MRKHSDNAVNGNRVAHDNSRIATPKQNIDSKSSMIPTAPLVRLKDHRSENCEFQRMHASLEERSLALQTHKHSQRRIKTKQLKKGQKEIAPQFSPATLNLASQTTQELVDDAADQMAQGMNQIGQRTKTNVSGGLSSVPGQSSLAAVASRNWKMRLSNVPNQRPHQTNPFAALEDDSDKDDELNTVQQFQFKPASFSFSPSFPNARPVPDDIDPDL